MLQPMPTGVRRFLWLQVIVVVSISILMSVWGIIAVYSALFGGIICILGNSVLARKFFRYTGARAAKKIVSSLFWGEALKFIITVVLFCIALKYLRIQALPFLLSYIVTQNLFWFSPLLFKS
jgi:ATP synthase protein I